MGWTNADRADALDRADQARGNPAGRGSARHTYPDGSTRETDPAEGTITRTDRDGTVSIEFTDGDENFAKVVFHPDGSRTIYDPNGHATSIPAGGWLTDDGVAERLPDGSTREVDEDGDVHYTDRDGRSTGGYDAGEDETTVVHGDGSVSRIWHFWGHGGGDLTTDPPTLPDGVDPVDPGEPMSDEPTIDADLEAWIDAIEAREAAELTPPPESVLDDIEWEPAPPIPARPFDPSAAELELRDVLDAIPLGGVPGGLLLPHDVGELAPGVVPLEDLGILGPAELGGLELVE